MSTTLPPSVIWSLLYQIPTGYVVTYGQLAELAGVRNYGRVVGNILRQLPSDSDLPWHRVINHKGEIAFPVGSSRYTLQKERLENEGVTLIDNKINLKQYRWHGE